MSIEEVKPMPKKTVTPPPFFANDKSQAPNEADIKSAEGVKPTERETYKAKENLEGNIARPDDSMQETKI